MTLSSRAIEAGARAMWDSLKGDTHSGIAWDHHGMALEQRERFTRMAQACLTAALAAEGMVLVPKEPTAEMLQAGARSYYDENSWQPSRIYRAMLSAHQEDEKSEGKPR
jgi:hypothetical protein